jgi:hypothetical protein
VKSYVPLSIWNDSDTLIETAVEGARHIEQLWTSTVNGLWEYYNNNNNDHEENKAFDAKVIILIRAKVEVGVHRTRIMYAFLESTGFFLCLFSSVLKARGFWFFFFFWPPFSENLKQKSSLSEVLLKSRS